LPAEQRYAKFVWGKLTTIQDAKSKEIEAVELYVLKEIEITNLQWWRCSY
jgi:SecD/SecF fusion protein